MVTTTKRNLGIDYLKCVLIILMVMFHLVYFGDKYPYLKNLVYTFHMPGFLLLSGYLANVRKPAKDFLRTLRGLAVPYLLMEACYIVMASILPIREHIDQLTVTLFFERLLLHPIGPYWFIHTLIVCETCYYCMNRLKPGIAGIVLTGTIFYLLASPHFNILSFDNAMYFLAGATLRSLNADIDKVFFSRSPLVFVPLIFLFSNPENFNRGSIEGILIVYFTLSAFLYIYRLVKIPDQMLFIGRHTYAILLFSPIFTLLAKYFVPLFAFDPTAILFLVIAVAFVITGSFTVARLLDLCGVSRLIYGKNFLNP